MRKLTACLAISDRRYSGGPWNRGNLTERIQSGKVHLRFGSPQQISSKLRSRRPIPNHLYPIATLQKNITVVTNWVPNEVSSTMARRHLSRGLSVKYMLDDYVVGYIRMNELYGTSDTT